jgi:hypothetical protein
MPSDPRYEKLSEELLSAADSERLEAKVREGIDSGPGVPAEEVFARLRRKYATLAGEWLQERRRLAWLMP